MNLGRGLRESVDVLEVLDDGTIKLWTLLSLLWTTLDPSDLLLVYSPVYILTKVECPQV